MRCFREGHPFIAVTKHNIRSWTLLNKYIENCKTYKFLHIFVTQDEQLDDNLKQAVKVIATVKGKKVGVLKHQQTRLQSS